jgi:hypothetical protein
MVEDLDADDPEIIRFAVDWLLAGPQVAEHSRFVWTAFRELCSERPLVATMGAPIFGPIPVTRILEYARHEGLDKHETHELKMVVGMLDAHDRDADAKARKRK